MAIILNDMGHRSEVSRHVIPICTEMCREVIARLASGHFNARAGWRRYLYFWIVYPRGELRRELGWLEDSGSGD